MILQTQVSQTTLLTGPLLPSCLQVSKSKGIIFEDTFQLQESQSEILEFIFV